MGLPKNRVGGFVHNINKRSCFVRQPPLFFILVFFPLKNLHTRDLVIFRVIWPILRSLGTSKRIYNVVRGVHTLPIAMVGYAVVLHDTHTVLH